jgi:hypothetical protein
MCWSLAQKPQAQFGDTHRNRYRLNPRRNRRERFAKLAFGDLPRDCLELLFDFRTLGRLDAAEIAAVELDSW